MQVALNRIQSGSSNEGDNSESQVARCHHSDLQIEFKKSTCSQLDIALREIISRLISNREKAHHHISPQTISNHAPGPYVFVGVRWISIMILGVSLHYCSSLLMIYIMVFQTPGGYWKTENSF